MRLSALIQSIPHLVLDLVLAIVILALVAMSLVDLPAVVHAFTIVMIGGGVLASVVVKIVQHAGKGRAR